ncbi:MAG: DUF488 family protein [Chromatiales bacterium]|nr:DUF488 family protein [Chromatiales bacterium]
MRPSIQIKRIYDPPSASDGIRILVERLWPRGFRKDALQLDLWEKEVGASTSLRQWFGHAPEKWPEFQRRYHLELRQNPKHWQYIVDLAKREPLTLLYSARDTSHNNAVAFRLFLLEELRSVAS